jgi:hypothetical protein
LVRWRLQRVSLSPEDAGLCGCWQFVVVWREQKELRKGKVIKEFEEYSFYCTSAAHEQYSAQQLLEFIRGHWAAIENGSHYRRDVSLGEDASQISGRTGAFVMATLRNLLLGLYELSQHRGQTKARTFPSWRRQLTTAKMMALITRTR